MLAHSCVCIQTFADVQTVNFSDAEDFHCNLVVADTKELISYEESHKERMNGSKFCMMDLSLFVSL
jgi:hypothetical protein